MPFLSSIVIITQSGYYKHFLLFLNSRTTISENNLQKLTLVIMSKQDTELGCYQMFQSSEGLTAFGRDTQFNDDENLPFKVIWVNQIERQEDTENG